MIEPIGRAVGSTTARAGEGGQSRSGIRRLPAEWFLAACGVGLLALTFRPIVEGDGVGYYTYLHAVFVSHSLDYANEYAAAIASHTPLYLPWLTDRTASGRLTDLFPVGSAVLSTPAYLVALALHRSGEPQYGSGSPFIPAVTLASLLYGLAALAISYVMADAVVRNRGAAMIGVLGGLFATPFFFYLVSDPSYSHTFSAFLASAFIYVAMQYVPRLFAKGGVVRDLLLWRQAHTSPDVVSGLLLLLLEAACLVVVLVLARRLLLRNSPAEEAG